MERTLYIIRGLSGVGKNTLAEALVHSTVVISADDWMVNDDGEYEFDPKKLPQVHAKCQAAVAWNIGMGNEVAVANTFACRWEMEPYLRMAEGSNHRLVVIDLFNQGMTDEALAERNIHGAPAESIANMRRRWEHDWRNGDPRPPWERVNTLEDAFNKQKRENDAIIAKALRNIGKSE